jgi:hypothetical protein
MAYVSADGLCTLAALNGKRPLDLPGCLAAHTNGAVSRLDADLAFVLRAGLRAAACRSIVCPDLLCAMLNPA